MSWPGLDGTRTGICLSREDAGRVRYMLPSAKTARALPEGLTILSLDFSYVPAIWRNHTPTM